MEQTIFSCLGCALLERELDKSRHENMRLHMEIGQLTIRLGHLTERLKILEKCNINPKRQFFEQGETNFSHKILQFHKT